MTSTSTHPNPLDHPEVRAAGAGRYALGYLLSLGLMFVATALVLDHALSGVGLLAATAGLALAAILVQFRFLFGLDLSEGQVWQTTALVLTVPLFILMIVLTVWMFHTLALHTHFPGTGM